MAIPTDTAGLAIAIAAGLLKLSQRVDDIAAEERASQGDLAFPMIPAILPPRGPKMVARLHCTSSSNCGLKTL
jgi:hypothetical protein